MENKIKQYRKAKGMTQDTVAKKSNLTTRNLQKIEAGSDPQISTVLRIAKTLEKSIEELYPV